MKKAKRMMAAVMAAAMMTGISATTLSYAADDTVKNYEYFCKLSNEELIEEYKELYPDFTYNSLERLRYSINYFILMPNEAELRVYADKETIDFTDDIYAYLGFPSRSGKQMTSGYSMTDNLGTGEIENYFEIKYFMDTMTAPVVITGNDEDGKVQYVNKPNEVTEYEAMRRELAVMNSPLVTDQDGRVVFTWKTNSSGKAEVAGDANIDGKVTVSDAVAVLQYIANNEKYPLGNIGTRLADIDGEEGLTGGDATAIQRIDAGIWDES